METILTISGPWLLPLLFAGCFGGLAFAMLHTVREALREYSETYAVDTARQLEDTFLFFPPRRIYEIALISSITVFFLFFLIFGNITTTRGWISGLLFGLAGGFGALNTPRVILAILRKRRLQRFNEQLVDALTSMSNSLKAGFSILQAFESIVEEDQNPISQEFSVFLHQTRVGVRFEDALDELGERVGSEDLILTIRAIETARITGGNLTAVFDTIAETIRERIRIQGRIRSLTAQGRMQGLVVGSVPIILLFVMSLLDPRMMMSFFSSAVGLALLAVVIIFEILGALVIRKIVNIDV